MLGPFTKSPAFKSGVREVFKKVDKDNSGHIDKDELVRAHALPSPSPRSPLHPRLTPHPPRRRHSP